MTFKRLFTPMLVLGMFLVMGSMAYAQPIVCSIGTGTAAAPPIAGTQGAVAYPAGGPALPGSSSKATATGHTEPIGAGPTETPGSSGGGGLRVSCINNGAVDFTPGVIILNVGFGVPITNAATHPGAASGVRVTNSTGAFVAAGAGSNPTANINGAVPNVGISTINANGGTVTIGLGTAVATASATAPQIPTVGITFVAGQTNTFDLNGVLVGTNGKTGAVSANLSATGASIGTGSVNVVDAVTAGLVDPTLAPFGSLPAGIFNSPNPVGPACGGGATTLCKGGPAVLSSSGSAIQGNFTVKIQENYASVFKSAAQFNNVATGGAAGSNVVPAGAASVSLNLVFKDVPAGINISNCSVAITDATGATARGGNASVTPALPSSNTLTVTFGADLGLADADAVWVTCQSVNSGSAVLPLPSKPVTVQAELSPTGTALSGTNAVQTTLATGQVPRYQDVLQPAVGVPVVLFPASQTSLLIPFAVVQTGYNTGIAISNTSKDPFGASNGGAVPSEGTITFTTFKNDGSDPRSLTTSTADSGLSAGGVLKAGGTYTVNLSELLSRMTPAVTTPFIGYVFVNTNFTNAHGAATIYVTIDGSAALSSPVLSLPAISSAAPRATIDVGAGLGQ